MDKWNLNNETKYVFQRDTINSAKFESSELSNGAVIESSGLSNGGPIETKYSVIKKEVTSASYRKPSASFSHRTGKLNFWKN